MSNTALWDSVCKTDPKHTKSFKRAGGFSGTAIKPLYLIHKATELWGAYGEAWGAETAEHVIHGNTVFIKAKLWYPGKVGKAWVEHWGGDVLVKGEKSIPNDEAFKMAFTDAVGKCLVQLGFSADVHFGMFDDSKYVDERVKEEKAETAAAMKKRFNALVAALKESSDPAGTWHENIEEINGFKAQDQTFYDELVKIGAKRKEELEQEAAMQAGMSPGFNAVKEATNVQ